MMHPEFRETTMRHWERELELAYREARRQDRGIRPEAGREERQTWSAAGGWLHTLAAWRIAGI